MIGRIKPSAVSTIGVTTFKKIVSGLSEYIFMIQQIAVTKKHHPPANNANF